MLPIAVTRRVDPDTVKDALALGAIGLVGKWDEFAGLMEIMEGLNR